MENVGLIISAAGLAIVIVSSVGGVVWKLARSEMALRAEFTRDLAALSAKLYQVEIWARDEFVRKGSFEAVIARMEKGFGDLRGEITGRLDRMADRLEHMDNDGRHATSR